jgi:hypothetical protein
MKVTAKLSSAIPGAGFVIRRGDHIGQLDDRGIVWIEVDSTHRIPGAMAAKLTVGISASRFLYVMEPMAALPAPDKRADVKAAILKAEAAAAANKKAARA